MDALLFLVIMVAALVIAAVVIGRAQRAPSPDDPTPPQPGEDTTRADDPRDRPAGSGAELDAPHSSELEPGEAVDPAAGGEDVTQPSGNTANEPREPGRDQA